MSRLKKAIIIRFFRRKWNYDGIFIKRISRKIYSLVAITPAFILLLNMTREIIIKFKTKKHYECARDEIQKIVGDEPRKWICHLEYILRQMAQQNQIPLKYARGLKLRVCY